MKHRIKILLAMLALISCSDGDKKYSYDIYIYYDVTEGIDTTTLTEYKQDVSEVLKSCNVSEGDYNGGKGFGSIVFHILNHEYFSKPLKLELKPRDSFFGIHMQNQKIVKKYLKTINDTLKYIFSRPLTVKDTTRSIIYLNIIKGLDYLIKSKNTKKVLIIYSDMIEHNPDFNLSFINRNIVSKNFVTIQKTLENIYRIKFPSKDQLKGINISIVSPDHEKYREQRLYIEKFCKYLLSDSISIKSSYSIN